MSLPGLTLSPLFVALPADACAKFEREVTGRTFAPQSTIVREGQAVDGAFVILDGRVAVRHHDRETGIDVTLDELRPGQVFGEMALLTGAPSHTSALALAPTTCAILNRTEFERVLHDYPQASLMLNVVLAERLHRSEDRAGVDFVNLARVNIDPAVITLLPPGLVSQHRIVPIAFRDNRLTLAMTNPNNIVAFDDVRRVLRGVLIEPVAVSDDDFRRFV